ncbi:YchJ family protein [Alishewanella sp. d11]|uniref:YchJ family protein n=1 Tax=Alishewanella sp. d11 TaxID=3414030 RepID=UPI003BF7D59B
MMNCYCCSGKSFTECCAPYLSGVSSPDSCEALMRSRFSAYCLADTVYLLKTHHPSMHTSTIADEITEFAKRVHFCGLSVKSATQCNEKGQVHFIAYFLHEQKLDVIAEVSDFIFEDNRWYYSSGKLQPTVPIKVGRNDHCPCGSGKKSKQCATHLASGQQTDALLKLVEKAQF